MGFYSRARSVSRPLFNTNFPSRVSTTAPGCDSCSKFRLILGSSLNSTEKGLGFYQHSTDKYYGDPASLPNGKILFHSWVVKAFSDAEIAYITTDEACFRKVTDALVTRPSNHKMELEADCISLLLMAYAGYDPQVVVELEKKASELLGNADQESLTHPSHKKLAEFLSQSKVLEEALLIYKENKSRATQV